MAQDHLTEKQERVSNVFPLGFSPDTQFKYHLWVIDPIPTTPKLREKIRSYLWRKALHRPVFPYSNDNKFVFAVADWGAQESVEYIGDGEKRYSIVPTDQYGSFNIANINEEQAEFAAAMLQQEFDLHLRKNPRLARGYSHNQYFLIQPDKPYNPNPKQISANKPLPEIDILRGFTFRVAFFKEFGLCLIIDAITSYLGRTTLAEYNKRGQIPQNIEAEAGLTRWVNDYGNRKQSVYLLGPTEKTIATTYLKDGQTVFQYLINSNPQIKDRITSNDQGASVIYRLDDRNLEEKHYTAATSLLKPKFNNSSSEVRSLNDTPAFPPDERLRRIQAFRELFFLARFAGEKVFIKDVAQTEAQIFKMPELIFGKEQSLGLNVNNETELESRKNWGNRKLQVLREHGPLERKDFLNPFFVYPASLDQNGLLDKFLEKTKAICKDFGQFEFNPELSSYEDHSHARNVIDKVRGIVDNQRGGFILLALPNNPTAASQIYAGVKTQLAIPLKCFSSSKLRQKAYKDLSTYATLNALGMLVENGTRLWGLAKPLNYETHFGFDVARTKDSSLMGASVIMDVTASHIRFAYKVLAKRDSYTKREGIPTQIIGKFVLEQLEDFYKKEGRLPQSILFQRDGRFLEDELKGIETAIDKAVRKYPKTDEPMWTAVAIQKNPGIKLRMFDIDRTMDRRPVSGSYMVQTDNVGHLITAGAPTLRQGTPKPLQIELINKNITIKSSDVVEVMEDLFYLSQLNWNAPEVDINLPVTLRFTDQKLERFALEIDDEIQDDEWEFEDEDFDEE